MVASQVDVRITQLGIQLSQFDISYAQNIDLGRSHLQEFDAAIAKSPCHTTRDALSNCARERDAEAAYHAAKDIVEATISDIDATVKRDATAMNQTVHEADSIK